jgi:hypothetical protein
VTAGFCAAAEADGEVLLPPPGVQALISSASSTAPRASVRLVRIGSSLV